MFKRDYGSFGCVDISALFKNKVSEEKRKIEYKFIRIRCFSVNMKTRRTIHGPNCECFGKCECGVDKVGSGIHSDWCPKHV